MYRPCLHCEGKTYDPDYCPEICQYGEDRRRLKELEEAATTIPVRCKDCADFCKGKCDNLLGLPNPYPDSFCSFGKRRGDA